MIKPAKVVVPVSAAVAVIAAAVWFGLPSQWLSSFVTARLEAATGHRLKLSAPLEIQLWPAPALVADNVTFAQDDDPQGARVRADRLRIALAWSGLLTGAPRVTAIEIRHPVGRVPLFRDRKGGAPQGDDAAAQGGLDSSWIIDRATVTEGAVVMFDPKSGDETRIEHIGVVVDQPTARKAFSARIEMPWKGRPVAVEARASRDESQAVPGFLPLDFKIEGPQSMPSVSGTATVRLADAILSVDAPRVEIGSNRLAGQVSVDFGSRKPSVYASLEASTLDLAAFGKAPGRDGASAAEPAAWSADELGLDGLNFFDGQVKVSADRAVYGALVLSRLALEAKLRRGVAAITLAPTTLGGGQVQARLTVDASGPVPALRLQSDSSEIDIAPMVRDLAGFGGFQGHASGKLDLSARGNTPRDLAASASGTLGGALRDGRIAGQDLVRTVGSLAARLITGRDAQDIDGFDLGVLSGSFRFENGIGRSDDILLDGPTVRMTGQGTIDVPRQEVSFEFKPKLTLGKGQTGLPGGIDISVPFNVEGPWTAPSVRPGMGLPSISSADFGILPKLPGAGGTAGPEIKPDDLMNNFGSIVSDLIANGARQQASKDAAGDQPDPAGPLPKDQKRPDARR